MDRNPLAEVPEPAVGPGKTALYVFNSYFAIFFFSFFISFLLSVSIEGLMVVIDVDS